MKEIEEDKLANMILKVSFHNVKAKYIKQNADILKEKI